MQVWEAIVLLVPLVLAGPALGMLVLAGRVHPLAALVALVALAVPVALVGVVLVARRARR